MNPEDSLPSEHPAHVSRREVLKTCAATTIGAALPPALTGNVAAARAGQSASASGRIAPLSGRVFGRAAQPHRVPPGRHGRRDDLPGGYGRLVAFLAAQQAGGIQRALHLRGRLRERPTPRGPRAGGTGPRLETLRPARHGQRRRRKFVRAAAFSQGPLPRTIPVCHGRVARQRPAVSGRNRRLEPVRAGRRRQRQLARGSPGVSTYQHVILDDRGRVFLERPELHGHPRQPRSRPVRTRRFRALGWTGQGPSA